MFCSLKLGAEVLYLMTKSKPFCIQVWVHIVPHISGIGGDGLTAGRQASFTASRNNLAQLDQILWDAFHRWPYYSADLRPPVCVGLSAYQFQQAENAIIKLHAISFLRH